MRDYSFAMSFDDSVVGYIEFKGSQVRLSSVGSSGSARNRTRGSDVIGVRLKRASSPLSPSSSPLSPSPSPSSSPSSSPSPSPSPSSGAPILDPPPGEGLSTHFIFLPAQIFTRWELFANIYAFYTFVAEFPPGQRIPDGIKTLRSELFPRSIAGFVTKTFPPVIEYGDLGEAFLSTAWLITKNGIDKGILMEISLDGRIVAAAKLIRRPSLGES